MLHCVQTYIKGEVAYIIIEDSLILNSHEHSRATSY